ncbi:MAG: DUF4923 family protein [Bacteroidaceae bacterium]|nr:DUF4923 family protein [Bacteroidaceae bacterium]
MKKSIIAICAAACTIAFTSCGSNSGVLGSIASAALQGQTGTTTTQTTQTTTQQSTGGLGSILGGLTGGSGIGSVISSMLGITTTQITGTWVYQQPAVLFESDNLLTKAGGQLAAQAIEKKLDTYFQKVGISQGKLTMTFDNNGNFTQNVAGKTQTGTYTVDNGNVCLTYASGTQQFIGTTQFDGNNLVIVVDMTKLLNFAKNIASSSNNSTLNTISSVASGVNGMKAGLKFTKQ